MIVCLYWFREFPGASVWKLRPQRKDFFRFHYTNERPPSLPVLFCRTVLKVWILTETQSDRDFYAKRVLFYFDSMASSRTLIEE